MYTYNGTLFHQNQNLPGRDWVGQKSFGAGDVVGLLLDCDAGTLAVKKNGVRLGVAFTGLTGEFCWAASLSAVNDRVRIGAADAAAAGW